MASGQAAAQIIAATIDDGLNHVEITPVVSGFIQRLTDAVPAISRMLVGLPTLHPTYVSGTWTWQRGEPLETERHQAASADDQDWLESPLFHAISGSIDTLRANLTDPAEVARFPVFRTFANAGHTDYLLRLIAFEKLARASGVQGIIVTFLSDRPGGFTADDEALLEAVLPAFALSAFRMTLSDVARNLLSAYLGADAGRRVLSGKVHRGAVDRINAAILFADFRHFTETSESMPVERIIPWLNAGLAAIGDPVGRHGGQVLKFIGDGLLAIFPAADDPAAACRAASAAARDAMRDLAALSAEPAYEADFALHVGEVGYGNIGASDRLDFTVIGSAVNEVSRMEALCDELGVRLVMSERFASCLDVPVTDLGQHRIRGIRQPRRLMTLTES